MTGVLDWSALPPPADDGAADHLPGVALRPVPLPATGGGEIDLAALTGTTVVFVYPMTARPGVDLPPDWDAIPGARGCTPQACAFRDLHDDLRQAGADAVFGLSANPPDWQSEAAERLHLPYALLSDETLTFAREHRLPTFTAGGLTLLRRLTLILDGGRIEHALYPVFPPDRSAAEVLERLRR